MDNTEATIPLQEEIPVILTVVDQKTGQPVPNAVLSNVAWSEDGNLGTFIPDPNNPNQAIFKPNKAGVTHIIATAMVTIP